jgi:extradiol dioxygenase family protein
MTESIKKIIYPVKDLAKARTLYSELLGVKPYMDEAYYVGFNVGG